MTNDERARIHDAARKRATELGPLTDNERQAMRPLLQGVAQRAYSRAAQRATRKTA